MNKKTEKAAKIAGRLAYRIDFRQDFQGVRYGNACWSDGLEPFEGWFLHTESPEDCDRLESGDSLVEFLERFPYRDRIVFAGARRSRRYAHQRGIKIRRRNYLLPVIEEE